MKPVVSVCIMAYNHEKYVAQAIESVLAQKTEFAMEIIIGEDRSTDGTRSIIKKYELNYPDVIKPIYHPENIGPFRNLFDFCFPKAKGKYIAMLEGDDYWIDEHKLQKQFEFMELHDQVAVFVHNAIEVKENRPTGQRFKETRERYFALTDLLRRRIIGHTGSYFFRNNLVIPEWVYKVYAGDAALLTVLTEKGSIYYSPELMSAYRIHETSMERKFDKDPLAKAMRDINQFKVYIRYGVVSGEAKIIVLKKIVWNYTYRLLKGVSIGKLGSRASDMVNVVGWSVRLLWYSLLTATTHNIKKAN